MKNLFFIPLLILCFLGSVHAHEEPPKTKKEKAEAQAKQEKMIRNGISKVTIWKHDVENGIISDAKQRYAELNYNKKGLNTSILVYSNDSLIYKTVNVFDFDGNRILDFDFEEGKPAGNAIFQYSKEGLIQNIINIDSAGNVVSEDTYFCNPKALAITFSSFCAPGKLNYSYTYIYDESVFSGNCIEIIHRDSAENQVMRVVNVYDKNNIRQEKIIFNAENKQEYKFTYTYTESGDFSVIAKIGADGNSIETNNYSYDSKGNLTSVISKNKDGAVMEGLSYTYEIF